MLPDLLKIITVFFIFSVLLLWLNYEIPISLLLVTLGSYHFFLFLKRVFSLPPIILKFFSILYNYRNLKFSILLWKYCLFSFSKQLFSKLKCWWVILNELKGNRGDRHYQVSTSMKTNMLTLLQAKSLQKLLIFKFFCSRLWLLRQNYCIYMNCTLVHD